MSVARSAQLRVYLPCDVFPVRARVGVGTETSPLEELFIEAVREGERCGENTIESLRATFGLSQRLFLDLLFDLWRIGYVAVNYTERRVYLAGEATKPKGERIAVPAGEDVRQLMIDRIVGHVMPVGGDISPPANPVYVVPDQLSSLPLGDVTVDEIIVALRRVVARESDGGPAKEVLGAYIPYFRGQGEAGRRWLPIEILCAVAPDISAPVVRVVTTRDIPPGMRRRLEDHLTRMVAEQGDLRLSQIVRERAENAGVVVVAPTEPLAVVEGLEREVAATRELSLVECVSRHDELLERVSEVSASLAERRISEARYTIVSGAEAHEHTVSELIKGAKRQLVIVSPFLSEPGLARYIATLNDRLGNGVRVFLLWGTLAVEHGDASTMLDNPTRARLVGLRQRFAGQFFCSYLPSRTHAKMVIQDDTRLLVTSLNLFDPSLPHVAEIGALVGEAEPNDRPKAVADALRWARQTYPDFSASRGISLHVLDRKPAGSAQYALEPPEPPGVGAGDVSQEVEQAAAALWTAGWNRFAAKLRDEAARPLEVVRLVRNEEHLRLLDTAIASAERRLLIVSDSISSRVVSAAFLAKLRARAGVPGGPVVRLVFRRFAKKDSDEDQASTLRALERIASETDGRFSWSQVATHAKVLVWDDEALVSSFNPLSFAGAYLDRRYAGAPRQSSELGLRLSGPGAASAVLESLRRTFPQAIGNFPVIGSESPSVVDAVAARGVLEVDDEVLGRLLATLANEAGDGGPTAAEEIFSNASEPWTLLDQFASVRPGDAMVRRAVGACLSVSPLDSPQVSHWVRWLAEDAWARHDAIETALLVGELESPTPSLPSLAVALVATALVDPMSIDVVLAEIDTFEDVAEAERCVVALASLVWMLERGSGLAADLTYLYGESLGPAWSESIGAATGYWAETYLPFPTAALRGHTDRARVQDSVPAGWANLRTSVEEAANESFKFGSGKRTWDYLFGPSGVFGRLHVLAANADTARLREWLRSERIDDADTMIREATVAALGSPDGEIAGNKRKHCAAVLGEIVDLARDMMLLLESGASVDFDAGVGRAQVVATVFNEHWQSLEVAACDLAPLPSRRVVDGLLIHLRTVLALE